MFYVFLFLCFLAFGGIAMTIGEGLWNNTVLLFAVTFAALVAVFGGPALGVWIMDLMGKGGDIAWYFVFGGMWLVFAVTVTIFRLMVDRGSRVKVRFIPQLEMIGGPLMGLLVTLIFVGFATYTLDRAPFKAGAWDVARAAGWQKSAFAYSKEPFRIVLKAFATSEGVDDEQFLGKLN